jgi:hypothetical protein
MGKSRRIPYAVGERALGSSMRRGYGAGRPEIPGLFSGEDLHTDNTFQDPFSVSQRESIRGDRREDFWTLQVKDARERILRNDLHLLKPSLSDDTYVVIAEQRACHASTLR